MESGNGGDSSEGVCITVADSDDFLRALAILQRSYLYEESKQLFTYNSAFVVKNAQLEEKYKAFCTKKRHAGYSEEDLKETYGFLLFDDVEKANALGEKGLLTGNSDLTTLGDPSKGVYISMYSDCLDPNRWCHPKSGHIVIIKLTRGKIKSVTENYTQTLTTPTEGFDCHVSEHLSSVSSQTSSFLAFERTQYYIYEHPLNGSRETALSPSAACPLAIVSFSYMNSKTTVAAPQGTREEEKPSGIYWPWRGQLQIGSKSFTVGLRSKAGALIPVKLSPVLKVCRAISVSDLQRSLPRTGFKTCLTGEAFLDGLYCNLFELVPSQEEQKDSFSLLLSSIQEKNVALSVPLVDGGFLLLMHSSQFIQNDDASSEGNNVLQSLFVFPQSRLALRAGTDFEHKNSALSSVVLQLAPALNYGECEVERLTTDCSEELCDVLLQHLQNYNQRTNSKTMSPSSEEYDTHQCSCTQRNNTRTLQRLTSYLSRPGSFQLPLSKVSEILLAEMEEQREDLEEDVYVFPSSSECMGLEDRLDTPNVSVMNVWPPTKHENNKLKDLQAEDLSVQNKPGTIVSKLNKVLDVVGKELHTSHSQTHPAEFIVTISTAEQGVAVETVNLQLPMVPVNSLNHETGRTVSDCTEAICLTKSKEKRPARGPPKKRKLVSSALVATPIVDMSKTPVEDSNDKEKPEKNQQISDTWKWKMKKTSPKCKTVEAVTVAHGQPSLQSTFLKELELQPMEKTEHQLPVISHCGQILVPFGYVCTANEMKSLKRKLSTNDKQEPKKPLISASVETELHFPTMDGINVTKSTDVAPREGDLNTGVSSLDSVPLNPEHEKSDDSLLKSQEIDVVYDKPIGALCPDKSLKKRCISLAKLKSVFAKRERHTEVLTKEMTSNNVQDTPLISTSETTATTSLSLTSREVDKGDHKISDLVLNDISSSVPNQMLLNETSTELEKSEVEKCGFQSSPKSRSQVRKHTNKRHGIRRCPKKIKTLKMPPGIPGERFKREWWLHCGPSAFPESETPQNKDGSQNNSLRNAANKEENKVFSPTDALNLLAELALGDNSNTLPLHPKTALEQKSKTNENNLDLMKNTITEQQSVFRLLLRENTTQVPPHLRSPSPRPLVGNRESVALVFKEHAYASPLPSTPLSVSPTFLQQVSLVCGAPKMRLNHLKPCMDENKSSYPPVSTEDQSEPNRTQEYPKENVHFNQKFRNSRVFVDEGGSLRVTRQWPGKYDFSLDSRIAIGQVEKAVSRVLHGPWAFPPQEDSCVRLIIHLWIGLFYSRSTPRWVHVDLDFTYSSTTLDVGSLANSSDSPLDLSKKSSPASDQEPVIWDLSLPNAVTPDHDVGRNETSVSIEKMMGMEKINSPKSTPEPHKEQLEAEGHTAVAPSEFFTKDISSSLHIILRNEDIAKHICEVPDLLKLKKSPHVLFAGIDTSADVVNLTHRELFVRGGFIVIDRAALQHLNLCSMNKILEILKMLNRKGKWKWMLHHRDSRRLKEDASTSAEAKEKCLLLSRGQEAALLKVLPYHECDLMSQDQPDYLTCLVRLQVQKISYRYAVCVTDRSHEALERNGILTVTMNSFLTKWPSEAFTLRPQAPSSVTSAEAVQF
ncbi:uncharacterized protein tasor2 isoform X2 [Gouania willdenowi]|uniref:uncharacterized protein tasor2 isoform X2 n=1 Tax=Gouania willdenowi TaxID=441366 RepID=UPI00105590A8|nr:uncharacterized protein LOC114464448 isoform X2 [Gouania willdenowi]